MKNHPNRDLRDISVAFVRKLSEKIIPKDLDEFHETFKFVFVIIGFNAYPKTETNGRIVYSTKPGVINVIIILCTVRSCFWRFYV